MDSIPDECAGGKNCTVNEVRSRHCGVGGDCEMPFNGPSRRCAQSDGQEIKCDDSTHEGYGGIWVNGQPFQLNGKCIIIGLMVACVYLLPKYAGEGNLWMMAFIFCLTYIGISLYDAAYNCDARLTSGRYSVTGMFKPQHRSDDRQRPPPGKSWAEDQEAAYRRSVNFAHAAIIGPLVMISSYWASIGKRSGIYALAFGVGALGFLYHAIRLIWPRDVRR